MTNQAERAESLRQNPCPICGQTTFKWGTVGTGSVGSSFNEDEVPPGFFSQPRHAKLVARECADCGNVQWFTK